MGLTDKLKKATASIQWGAKTMSGRHLDQATVRGEIKDVLQQVINYSYERGEAHTRALRSSTKTGTTQ